MTEKRIEDESETTTIQLKRSTKARLDQLGKNTYDFLLNSLMDRAGIPNPNLLPVKVAS